MIENLKKDQIQGIFDALPVDFIFVDENDCLRYWNKTETRARKAPTTMVGKDMRLCHQKESLPMLEEILADFKSGKKNEAEFWMLGLPHKILNRFFAIRDKSGKYLGILEYLLDFTAIEEVAEAKKDAYSRS